MPDIDLSTIRPGDTVRVRIQTVVMQQAGVAPVEFAGTVYLSDGLAYVGGSWLLNETVAILEHIPDRPDWTDAMVIKDTMGDVWARNLDGSFHSVPRGRYMPVDARHFRQFEEENGPIAVVLDHDGNPPAPEQGDGPYRVDGLHVYAADRPVATFHRVHEARAFVNARNIAARDSDELLWLDADQLDELPHLTVVLPRDSKHVRQRLGSPAGPTWFTPGRTGNQSSESIAPARLLWAPEAER